MNMLRRRREQPAQPVDHEHFDEQLAKVLREEMPLQRPANEFAPQTAEYTIDAVASFLHRHIKELDEARDRLTQEADTAKLHLAEIERRLAVTNVAREALAETSAKLIEKSAALEEPKQEQAEAPAEEPVS